MEDRLKEGSMGRKMVDAYEKFEDKVEDTYEKMENAFVNHFSNKK